MTVQTTAARIDFIGNGATLVFAIPFPFIDPTFLLVLRTDTDTGEETTLVLDSGGANGYTVEGAGEDEGELTVVTAPTSTERLSIIRQVPITQEADFRANDPLPAETFEDSLDKLTMICQDLQAQIDRCLHFSQGTSSDVSAVLPAPEARTLLGWSADETAIVNYLAADFSDLIISEFIDEFLQVTTLEEAQDYLGITDPGDLGPLATLEPTGTGFLHSDGDYGNELEGKRVGYMDCNATVQNGNYGFVLADRGLGIQKDSTATPTWTIPANVSIAFPVGTTIYLQNIGASGNVSLAITSDTLQLAGGTSTGTRTLAPGFIGGIVKVSATRWFVFGAGAT